ncbi:hypothetical protein [Brasilonema sennae]|uniref:hypothetical protein n=1 Tax=Brasilonema sennae TaxID=1397703 RepID=UPI001FE706D6|nr:hypothetical protein [Brasilonema sennae]
MLIVVTMGFFFKYYTGPAHEWFNDRTLKDLVIPTSTRNTPDVGLSGNLPTTLGTQFSPLV